MCKRQVLAGHYYRAMQKPGVEPITEASDHVEPVGVVTAGGARYESAISNCGYRNHAH